MNQTKILQIGEISLRKPCLKVLDILSEDCQRNIQILIETHKERKGVGIAAPQIGIQQRIFLTELPLGPNRPLNQTDEMRIYINPTIVKYSVQLSELYESCLSVGDGNFCLPIVRPKIITLEAYDENGKKFELTSDGFLARVIQHEYDHLDGILFIDKDVDIKRAISIDHYRKLSSEKTEYVQARTINVKEVRSI
jgi:peptide deformylase